MTPQRWARIKEVFQSALERNEPERSTYLDETRGMDEELRRHVELLLQEHRETTRIQSPVKGQDLSGKKVSHYNVIEKLGAGGMGVVYKAEDTRLHRTVALKFLRPDSVEHKELTTRFRHEAEAAASLDHSNICTIHEIDEADGQIFLVMALVDGPSLKETIAERPLKLEVALDLAIQIAEGLAAAHEAGIVHRDIKPGNILMSRRRQVKILDFGLAHLGAATQVTKTGAVIGTPAYMSPEQVRGEKADRRTDVWSLGVVLYEMLTGRLPFQGESGQAVALLIQNGQPEPPTALRSGLPTEVDHIVEKALAKNLTERYQHVEDLLVDLRRLKAWEDSTSGRSGVRPAQPIRPPWYVAAAVLITALVAVLATWFFAARGPTGVADADMSIVPFTTYAGREANPSFSPDGTRLVFDGNVEDENNNDIYVQMIGSPGLQRLTTDAAYDESPRFSPDGSSIAFLRRKGPGEKHDLMLIPAIGGPERKIAEVGPFAEFARNSHFAWSPDSSSLVVPVSPPNEPRGLFAINANGGELRRLTSPSADGSCGGGASPAFSPNGQFLAFVSARIFRITNICVLELGEDLLPLGEPRQLTSGSEWRGTPTWTRDGRDVIYDVKPQGGLWRVPADGSREPTRLAIAGPQAQQAAIGPKGNRLAFSQFTAERDIWRVRLSAAGTQPAPGAPFIASSRSEETPQYSPDGRRIAFDSNRSGAKGIWLCDAEGKNAMPLFVPTRGMAGTPRWSPDGEYIAFDSNYEGQWDVYTIRASGGEPVALTTNGANDFIPSWSRDGKWIYFASGRTGRSEVWKKSVGQDEAIQVTQNGGHAAFESADGSVVYYEKLTPSGRGIWRVPVAGGAEEKMVDGLWYWNFAVVEDGIYFQRRPGAEDPFFSIQFLDFASGGVTQVTSLRFGFHEPGRIPSNGLTVSPDRQFLLYPLRTYTGDIMLVENFR